MGEPGRAEDLVAATIARPEYQTLSAALRAFAGGPGRRVVYLVGNHDTEVWWNPEVRRALTALAGVVVIIASSIPMWNQILRYARGR